MHKRLTLIILCIVTCLGSAGVAAETLQIPGTGACEVILQELATAFNVQHPHHRVAIPPSSGSRHAMRQVAAGKCSLARVALPQNDPDATSGLRCLVFAWDAVVFAVGARVTVTDLSPRHLADIFAGKITNWQEVGGAPALIRALIREPLENSVIVIQRGLKEFQGLTFSPDAKLTSSNADMAAMLQKYKNAVGLSHANSLRPVQPPVQVLALDGIQPTPDNLQSGKYPLWAEYALVYRETGLDDTARRFIDFIFSEPGQAIIKKQGMIPVPRQ